MKPMTTEEIQRLKIWTEKQAQRRPAEIVYQDILQLIATIEAFTVDENCTVTTKDLIKKAVELERKACAKIADEFWAKHHGTDDGCFINPSGAAKLAVQQIGAKIRARSNPTIQEGSDSIPDEVRVLLKQGLKRIYKHSFAGNPGMPCEICGVTIAASIHDYRPICGIPDVPPTHSAAEENQPIIWTLTPHWFEGADPTATLCKLCNQAIDYMIHDRRLRGHEIEGQPLDLRSALAAIKPSLDPGMSALVDELIKGEEK